MAIKVSSHRVSKALKLSPFQFDVQQFVPTGNFAMYDADLNMGVDHESNLSATEKASIF